MRCLAPWLALGFVACQGYRFREVPSSVADVETMARLSTAPIPPQLLIVQDTSGSMCEPIQRDAGADSCISTSGGPDVASYCSVCLAGAGTPGNAAECAPGGACASKMSQVAYAMQTALQGLAVDAGQLFLGLASFPSNATCGTGAVQVPIGDATATIPAIDKFYASAVPQGGTPTAATLTAAVASQPSMASGSGRYVLLITDGLPNCDADNPCGTEPWTGASGASYACASANYLATQGITGVSPPSSCQCSNGSCTTLDSTAVDCCTVTPEQNQAVASDECFDGPASVAAVAALEAQGITTFVVGLGYDYANASVLDQMAQAGGSDAGVLEARDPQALQAALQSLLGQIKGCNFELQTACAPAALAVSLCGQELQAGVGYSYDPASGPAGTVTLLRGACQEYQSGAACPGGLVITALAPCG